MNTLIEPDDGPGMLHRLVWIIEHGAGGADLRPQGMLEQAFQPVAIDHLGVVIEEEEHVTAGLAGRKVVHRGVIERPGPGQQPDIRLLRQLVVIGKGPGQGAMVLDNEDFVIGIAGALN